MKEIIKEFDSYFGWIMACSTGGFEKEDYEKLKDFLQKAISQTQKEAYEKGRLETIKEIEEKLPKKNIRDYPRTDIGGDAYKNGHNFCLDDIKDILNKLKVGEI